MKTFLKILFVGTFMISIATKSYSQSASATTKTTAETTTMTIDQQAKVIVDEMKTVTTLTNDQVSSITESVITFLKQNEKDIAQHKGNDKALAEAKKIRRQSLDRNIKAVVKDEQFVKIKNYLDNK